MTDEQKKELAMLSKHPLVPDDLLCGQFQKHELMDGYIFKIDKFFRVDLFKPVESQALREVIAASAFTALYSLIWQQAHMRGEIIVGFKPKEELISDDAFWAHAWLSWGQSQDRYFQYMKPFWAQRYDLRFEGPKLNKFDLKDEP